MPKKILLVDDDSDDREFFCEALEAISFETICYTASDGRKAINQLEKKEINIPDIIFMDINMPIMSGWQCLSLLKEKDEYKSIPVIMYSTSCSQEDIQKARRLGAISFFSKPPNYNNLKKGLEMVMEHLTNNTLPSLSLNSPQFIA